MKLRIYPTKEQKLHLDDWINTSRYVYNKTLEKINKNESSINFQNLRDVVVTNNTRKTDPIYNELSIKLKELEQEYKKSKEYKSVENDLPKLNILIKKFKKECKEYIELKTKQNGLPKSKNSNVKEWELKTPKEIRASSVKRVVTGFKAGFTKLTKNQILYFKMRYKRKIDNKQSIDIPKSLISIKNGDLRINPDNLKEKIKYGRTGKKYKNLTITHDVTLCKTNNTYILNIPIDCNNENHVTSKYENYVGVDPGVRTFLTTFGNKGCKEYHHKDLLVKLNKKIDILKRKRIKPLRYCDAVTSNGNKKRGFRKKCMTRIETRKSNLTNEFHIQVINELTRENDIIFFGDINSHDIVKQGRNRKLNRDINDLKFFKFKEKLKEKVESLNKKLIFVNEAYTSKTCSCCGYIKNNLGASKVYNCDNCKIKMGRDINASKNILMKGILGK
jgi:IS605 OrfB family transposase